MVNILIYTGIAIIIIGCLVCIYGAFKYIGVKNSDAPLSAKTDARLRFNRYRIVWMILAAIGCVLVLSSTLVAAR